MNPNALTELIEGSKIIFAASGGEKGPVEAEAPTIAFAFASVVAIRDIPPGQKLTEEDIWVKRPGGGDFTVLDYELLLGMTATTSIRRGLQIKKTDVKLA
jgi:N-acetylneuraminate synthase